jgi:hypothetical protein
MQFETWIKAVMLCVAALGSGSVLAAVIGESGPALSATKVQAQPAKRTAVKRVKKDLRGDVGQKDVAKIRAVPAVASTPALPLPEDGSALTLPVQQDKVLPADKVPPLALKGVRG